MHKQAKVKQSCGQFFSLETCYGHVIPTGVAVIYVQCGAWTHGMAPGSKRGKAYVEPC